MEIIINYQSNVPIYEQIVLQIKNQILKGQLNEGDPLKPMRTFSKTLGVSVITIQKAYEQLANEGFINSIVGKGTFVTTPDVNTLKNQKYQEIELQMENIINFAFSNGYEVEELIRIFKEKCKEIKMR